MSLFRFPRLALQPRLLVRRCATSAADNVKLRLVSPATSEKDFFSSGSPEIELARAEERVLRGGGRIQPLRQQPLAHYKELRPADWDSACQDIAAELGLTTEETANLAGASQKEREVQTTLFQEDRQDQVLSTRLAMYSVARDASSGALHCAYGRYDADLELEAADDTGPPEDHQVKLEHYGRSFAVLPQTTPDNPEQSYHMRELDDVWFDIPAGWRPASMVGPSWELLVKPQVVADHNWGSDWLLVRSDRNDEKWPAYKTHLCGPGERGKRGCSHADWFEVRDLDRRCVFRADISSKGVISYSWHARLLMERVPGIQLLEDWKACLQMRARAAWAAQLGMEQS